MLYYINKLFYEISPKFVEKGSTDDKAALFHGLALKMWWAITWTDDDIV